MLHRYALSLSLLTVLFVPSTRISAQLPDSDFATGGQFLYATDATEEFKDMARMSDGRIVLVGTRWADTGSELRVVRLLPDGTPDDTFGSGGAMSLVIADGNTQGIAVSVLADARVIATGTTEQAGARHMFACRITALGAPDPTFNAGAPFVSSVAVGGEHLLCMAMQADGRILLAGDAVTATTTSACVIRLLGTGGLDGTFGDGGVVLHNAFGGTELMSVHAMALDANGQAVLAGLTDLSSNNNVFILRLLSDGGLDPDYGTGGETVITDNAYDDYADVLVIAPGGDVYLAGSRIGVGGDDLVFYHIDANGTPLTFGTDIIWQIETSGSEYATRMIMDPEGRLIVSSTTYDENFVSHAVVLRVATNPSLDGSFGDAGVLEVTALAANAANALLLQPDGKLLVCGAAYPAEGAGEGLVVRYGDLPAGFAEHEALSDIRLAPNPCHARFTLTAGAASIDRVQVLDAAGRNVLEERIALGARNARSIELPDGLAPGVYAVLAWSGAQRSIQRLVVE